MDPLLGNVPGNLFESSDTLKVSPGDDTVNVVGVRLWTALNSTQSWRHRETAAQAYLNYLEAGGGDRFKMQNTMKLFQASLKVALTCCYDKLLNIS